MINEQTLAKANASLDVETDTDIGADLAATHIQCILDGFEDLRPRLNEIAEELGRALYDAHRRVRGATKSGIQATKVEVRKPGDVLCVYVLLPASLGGIG